MNDTFSDDYQTVAERIKIFREKYPEGSLRPADLDHPFRLLTMGDRLFIAVTAAAYRTPDDKAPGIGQAWEPVPGQTEYSRDSELMIAETSAWGRAIIAVLAADSRKVATRDEVTAAQQRRAAPQPAQPQVQQPAPPVVEQLRQVAAQPVVQTPPVEPTAGSTIVDALQRFTAPPAAQQPAAQNPPVAQQPATSISIPEAVELIAAGKPMPQPQAQQPRPVQKQGITPQPAPEAHDPAGDADNRSFVDSILLHILKNPESTKDDVREAWTALSQANLLHWRVEPFGGMDPDGDGRVSISELIKHIASTKK